MLRYFPAEALTCRSKVKGRCERRRDLWPPVVACRPSNRYVLTDCVDLRRKFNLTVTDCVVPSNSPPTCKLLFDIDDMVSHRNYVIKARVAAVLGVAVTAVLVMMWMRRYRRRWI